MKHPIPDDALDGDLAILGKKGGGKTYTAKSIVERLLDLGRRVLVLDPLGVWAGLRTSADGKKAGYPVAIFGGLHGDLPLDPAAAEPLARIIAKENLPAVIDLSELSKAKQQAFLFAFLHELRRTNTEALTIVLEEADVFAPQNPMGDDSKQLLGEIDWIARRGRFLGFRLITITQRPARLAKDVLTQCSVLIAHRLPAPQDRDAVKAWVDGNGDRDKAKEVFDTLAQLEVGQAWLYAPELGKLETVRFPKIKTLDTSATPKAGEKRMAPKKLAQVDVSQIREALDAATAAEEEKKPVAKQAARAASPAELEAAQKRGYDLGYQVGYVDARNAVIAFSASQIEDLARALRTNAGGIPADICVPKSDTDFAEIEDDRSGPAEFPEPAARTIAITAPMAKILSALKVWQQLGKNEPTREMVAALAGYSPSSGGFKNLLGTMRSQARIDYPTPGTISLLIAWEKMNVTEAVSLFRNRLTKPQFRICKALGGGKMMSRAQLAQKSGYEQTSGGFKNLLGQLRTLDVLRYPEPGSVQLTDWAAPMFLTVVTVGATY